ncbi:Hypothetical protein PHPALM_6824 [Phytophthora palmivora]|uniref:Uncharacterized protein n=1 Tax=Phytophthora palmivora TaxID=4796 RepID=A0A2P4YDV0_9STRA|nr:Hypothetical protein PHPALM_6824 [Phytophthora palmivora]
MDVAIVNAYIVFREAQKSSTGKSVTNAEFLLELHAEMLALGKRDFTDRPPKQQTESGTMLPPLPPDHEAKECPEYQI